MITESREERDDTLKAYNLSNTNDCGQWKEEVIDHAKGSISQFVTRNAALISHFT